MKEVLSKFDYNLFYNSAHINGYHICHISIGDLFIPSGKLVLGDLFYINREDNLTLSLAPGVYEVEICYVDLGTYGYKVALSKIKLSDEKAVYWKLATREEEDVEDLKEEEFFGFPVNSGLLCLLDELAKENFNKEVTEFYQENKEGNYYKDVLSYEFRKYAFGTNSKGDWNNHFIDQNQNVIMTATGFGDGIYPCYWGITENGEICELIIDFFVIDDVMEIRKV